MQDIIFGIRSAIDKNYKCEVFNLGNNKSENLMDFINLIESELNLKAQIEFKPMQAGDVKETYANIKKSISMLSYSPKTDIKLGIQSFIGWYKKYYNI